MATENENTSFIKKHSTFFMLLAIGLVLVEVQIFAIAVMKSGRQASIQVLNDREELVYESEGSSLTRFDKHYFEQNFGPLDNYRVRLETKDVPFPFRAWFFAAVGLPLGAMLLIAFIYTAFAQLLGLRKDEAPPAADTVDQSAMDRFFSGIARINVFVWGGLVFLAVLALWAVPNMATYLGQASMAFVDKYKWVFVAFFAVLASFLVWVIYLKYLLAKKTIETQADVQKFRLEMEYKALPGSRAPVEIEYQETTPNGEEKEALPNPEPPSNPAS